MPKFIPGDILKIKPRWCRTKQDRRETLLVIRHDQDLRRYRIQSSTRGCRRSYSDVTVEEQAYKIGHISK